MHPRRVEDDLNARRALLCLCVVLLVGCGGPSALDRLAAGEIGRVTGVRSGHVITLDSGLEVRLAGIEASSGAQPHGSAAKAALSELVLNREVQLLYGGQRRDRYDRALAQVRVVKGRRWVQGALLKAGAARVRTWPDNRALAAEMLEEEARARRRARGLWGLPAYRIMTPDEARGVRGFVIVEGLVGKVERGSGQIYLDFTEGRISARISQGSAQDFADSGKAPESLVGRIIRVRGMADGAGLRLDHPEPLEPLRSR